jgi:hypothetical protein
MEDKRLLQLKTVDDMFVILREKGRPLSSFKKGDTIHVWNKMEKGYSYTLSENPGDKNSFSPEFKPFADPGEILALGAFGGKYLNDCLLEFPAEWFWRAGLLGKLSPGGNNNDLNYFQIDSRLPLSEWIKKKWVPSEYIGLKKKEKEGVVKKGKAILADPERNPDVRGWFQWYCRYWMGRRIPELDSVQINRWKAFSRHYGAVQKNCERGDLTCRPRQRQALLHWAWEFDK